MSAPARQSVEIIERKDQLVTALSDGVKPASAWRIGTEHEKFVYKQDDFQPAPFDGRQGIEALLKGIAADGWKPIEENGRIIALTNDGANVTLEPGGQFELSGAPVEDIHQTAAEIDSHIAQVKEIGSKLGLGFLGLGFSPQWRRADIPWMPKGRYAIMRRYMPLKGNLGLDMMQRTTTVQVNLDFDSEADMTQKFRISLALQPLATALWANSPFIEGKPTGFLSTRSQVWTDTDPDRCGILPFVFEDGMGFERYVDWVLDAPMYFVYRDNRYIDVAGRSFRDFMAGKLPELPGERPMLGDWNDHLTTVFPEVRLKKFLEMRGADSGSVDRLYALSAFWVGLLYETAEQGAAYDLVKNWTAEDHAYLRAEAPRTGLKTIFRGRPLQELALQVLEISRHGLQKRKKGEESYLDVMQKIAESGIVPAEELLRLHNGRWNGDVTKVYSEFSF